MVLGQLKKKNKLSQAATWENLKSIMLSVTHCVIPFIRHSEKGKTIGKRAVASGVGWSEEGADYPGHDCGADNTAACTGQKSCNCTPKNVNFSACKKISIKEFCFVISLRTSPLTKPSSNWKSSSSFYTRILTQALYEEGLASEGS